MSAAHDCGVFLVFTDACHGTPLIRNGGIAGREEGGGGNDGGSGSAFLAGSVIPAPGRLAVTCEGLRPGLGFDVNLLMRGAVRGVYGQPTAEGGVIGYTRNGLLGGFYS